MPETSVIEHPPFQTMDGRPSAGSDRSAANSSLRHFFHIMIARRGLVLCIVGGLLLVCLLYCLLAPAEFEAAARVALRTGPASSLNLEGQETGNSASALSALVQTETVAGVLRSERLAWQVIVSQRLYQSAGFMGRFRNRFPGFRAESPDTFAQNYLLERFQDRLHVGTLPRSVLIEIRFRSRDPRLSADVVNALIKAYGRQQIDLHRQATEQAARMLEDQLGGLKARADSDDRKLAAFQKKHGILISPQALSNSDPGAAQHLSAFVAVDELGKELAAAGSERLLREAEYRAAVQGDPEAVLAFDPRIAVESGLSNVFRQLHTRHSELEQELAQLSIEHGPNFPRMLEIRGQLQDLERQIDDEKAKLREEFRSEWVAVQDHEQLVRRSLRQRTGEGVEASEAAAAYEAMRHEADSTRDLYLRMLARVEEAGLAAGAHGPDIWVVDEARVPSKPAAPNPPVYMAITLVAGLWIAASCALLMEWIRPVQGHGVLMLLVCMGAGVAAYAQAPTPSTSGLPTGVAKIPQSSDNRATPNPKDAPPVWTVGAGSAGLPGGAVNSSVPMAGPIAPGDLLEISEFHTPEFHSLVHVSTGGTVKLPLLDEVRLEGMDELQAEHAIASALVERGILNHPQVSVLVTAYVGQDVSVLGEVMRPGVYPYTLHHRLLDMISAASGLSPAAGGVANIYHRDDPDTPHPVVLDPDGARAGHDRNPELAPGDTVQVTRAGLIYVVGDVIRPGGFTVDPTQRFTVLKVLSLAWGPSQNASLSKALLIREQDDGGRTVTMLNLKKMLHGQDPDQPVHDHDILFVPDSTAKNLYNRSIESAIQSTIGVSIYAGMVYSQRF